MWLSFRYRSWYDRGLSLREEEEGLDSEARRLPSDDLLEEFLVEDEGRFFSEEDRRESWVCLREEEAFRGDDDDFLGDADDDFLGDADDDFLGDEDDDLCRGEEVVPR